MFLLAEREHCELFQDESYRLVARELLAVFRHPRPESARMPGLLWPFTAFLLMDLKSVGRLMDTSVATCRRFGHAWELAVALLFRAHIRVDLAGGLALAHADVAEIESLARPSGDRWLLSQVCGLRAEIDIQHGRYADARREYEAALRYAQQLGALTELPFILARVGEVWYRQGDSGEAEKLARRAVEDGDRLGMADARTYGTFLRSLIALDNGEPARARALHTEAGDYAVVATLPPIFEVGMRALSARILAAEGRALPDGVCEAREALRRGLESGAPEAVLANILLAGASVALAAGHPRTAVRLADAARLQRGELAASVPESREEERLRAHAAVRNVAARTGAPGDAPPTAEKARMLLDELVDGQPEPQP